MATGLRQRLTTYLTRLRLPAAVRAVRRDGLTYLDEVALQDLHDQVRDVEKQKRRGIILEAGCALGGSAIVMASAKSRARPLFVYDVFGIIPAPSDKDGEDVHARYQIIRSGQSKGIDGKGYYGYENDLYQQVNESFRRHKIPPEENNVHLIRGLFQDTLRVEGLVALAHIDGDWYESVMTCLQRVEPGLEVGGRLVIDDYNDWSGCRRAVDEYFDDKREHYSFIQKARLHIVRR